MGKHYEDEYEEPDRSLQVFVKGNKGEVGWIALPMQEEDVEQVIERATGDCRNPNYFLTDYICGYFPISQYDDLHILNKVATIIDRLDEKEQAMLRGWVNHRKADHLDLVEIGNVALMIREEKMEYLPGITNYTELGQYVMTEADVLDNIQTEIRTKLGLEGSYIDYSEIGLDYVIKHPQGYFVKEFYSNDRNIGYVRNDDEINPLFYTKEEFINLNLDLEMQENSRDKIESRASTTKRGISEGMKWEEKNYSRNPVKDIMLQYYEKEISFYQGYVERAYVDPDQGFEEISSRLELARNSLQGISNFFNNMELISTKEWQEQSERIAETFSPGQYGIEGKEHPQIFLYEDARDKRKEAIEKNEGTDAIQKWMNRLDGKSFPKSVTKEEER